MVSYQDDIMPQRYDSKKEEPPKLRVLKHLAKHGPDSIYNIAWSAYGSMTGYSSVHGTLKRLEKEGVVRLLREEPAKKGRTRKIYELSLVGVLVAEVYLFRSGEPTHLEKAILQVENQEVARNLLAFWQVLGRESFLDVIGHDAFLHTLRNIAGSSERATFDLIVREIFDRTDVVGTERQKELLKQSELARNYLRNFASNLDETSGRLKNLIAEVEG